MSSTGYRNTESLEQQLQAAKDALEAARVLAKTVSVDSGYSWADLIAFWNPRPGYSQLEGDYR